MTNLCKQDGAQMDTPVTEVDRMGCRSRSSPGTP